MTPRMIRRGVQGLFLPGPSVVGGVDTLRFYAAGAVTSGVVGRSTRRGWRGGSELAAGGDGTERRARGLAGKGTETLAAEIAIVAGCFSWHAECSL